MSLTHLIRTDAEVRDQLAAALTRPRFRPGPRLVPARSTRRNVTGKATRTLVQAFVQGQADVREVALACTVLAKLELISRSGWVDPDLLTPLPEMAQELLALLDVVPFENFEAARHLVLNPTFGEAGVAVGGADADLVVDDLLIDVKTTATAKASLDELRQLAGYALLWRTGGLHVLTSPGQQVYLPVTIRRVGLYYARHGQLVTLDLSDFLLAPGGDRLTAWWQARFKLHPVEVTWPSQRCRAAMEAWLEETVRDHATGQRAPMPEVR